MVTRVYCDICGKLIEEVGFTDIEEVKSFELILQERDRREPPLIDYCDICMDCAEKIKEAIIEVIKEIRITRNSGKELERLRKMQG